MNKDWQKFLASQNAVFDKERLVSFSDVDTTEFEVEKTYLCDLSQYGLIHASGEDALSFLHGQFTNDLNQVTTTSSQLSSYCNAKGRILSIFRIFLREGDYFLVMPRDIIGPTLKKLNMFKLMAKVELTDVSDELVVFGIAGPDADSVLNKNKLQLPKDINQCIENNETTVIRVHNTSTRLLFISTPEKATSIWQTLSTDTVKFSSNVWELHDIQSGIPQITSETFEAFTPQMVNLELIGGVSFQKGCYPGQEVVARTHYLGKPNRRMYRVTINNKVKPQVGENIFAKSSGEQPVGKIVTVQCYSDDICEALAVLRTEKENASDLHLESSNGSKITTLMLPYSLESDPD